MKQIFISFAAMLAATSLSAQNPRSVLQDPSFAKGFIVESVSYKDSISGRLTVDTLAKPVWHLCQPDSRFDAAKNTTESRGDNTIFNVAGNGNLMAKVIRVNPIRNVLYLECNASAEYTGIRRDGQPWVGLWVAQATDSLKLAACNQMELKMDYRVLSYEDCMGFLAEKELHSAICCASLVLRNANPESLSYGRLLRVVIPMFDNRRPGASYGGEVDTDGEELVYRPASEKCLSSGRFPKVRQKEAVVVKLLPVCNQAVKAASMNGSLPDSVTEDFVLEEFRVGWEMKGTFNASVEIKNLKLTY